MKVSVVKIKNILGIEELEFKPSDHGLTLVRGGNATGKTSVVSALQALLGGGNDATLLRHGAEAGEAVLVLDDGTEVGMRTDGEKTERWAKDPKRGRFSSVKATIDQWVNHGSFNPVEFLSTNPGSPGDRVRMVLAAAPIALSKEQVARVRAWAAMPAEPPTKDHLEEIVTGHALVGLDEVRKLIYEERRVVNRELDRARKGAERLRLSLPPGSAEGKDPGEAVKAWESALQSNQEAATAAEVQSVKEQESLGVHRGGAVRQGCERPRGEQLPRTVLVQSGEGLEAAPGEPRPDPRGADHGPGGRRGGGAPREHEEAARRRGGGTGQGPGAIRRPDRRTRADRRDPRRAAQELPA